MKRTVHPFLRGLTFGASLLIPIGIPAIAQTPLPDHVVIEHVVQALQDGTALPTLPVRYQQGLALFLATYDGTRRGRPGSEQELLTSLRAFSEQEIAWIHRQRQ